MTDTSIVLDNAQLEADDDLDHFICCVITNFTFCGKMEYGAYEGEADEVSCSDCMLADKIDREIYNQEWCPMFGRCIE